MPEDNKELQNDRFNDLDVEIVNLDEATLDEKDVRHLSPRVRFSSRQRSMQVIATISVIMLALLLIGANDSAIRNIFVLLPTPTATMPLGTDRFYVNAEPGWGHLFVDGKLVKHVPNVGDNKVPMHLSHGTHTLEWDAFPFPRQTCTVSVPPKYHTDTCEYNAQVGNGKDSGWLFSFSASLITLSDEQRASLIATVQAVLQNYTSSEIVQPEEAYALDALGQQQAIAREPLKVTVRYQLDIDATFNNDCGPSFVVEEAQGCSNQGQDCHIFCPSSNYVNTDSTVWNVFAAMNAITDYTLLDGKQVAYYSSDSIEPSKPYEHLVPLRISWDAMHWKVTSSFALFSNEGPVKFTSPVCDTALGKVGSDPLLSTTLESSYVGLNWSPVAVSHSPASCLNIVTMEQPLTSVEEQPVALCLYRFGIFLAANQLAHIYWPHMLIADAAEQHLAQQLYKTSIGTQQR